MEYFKPENFFAYESLAAAPLFQGLDLVWEALDRLNAFIAQRIKPLGALLRTDGDLLTKPKAIWRGQVITEAIAYQLGDATRGELKVWHKGALMPEASLVMAGAVIVSDLVDIGPGVLVESGAYIDGPTIIGANTAIRQGAYIRGSVLTGQGCVVGHATEAKNAVMLDEAKAGHFAYIGDSILGRQVNLGAGTKLANFKVSPTPIRFRARNGGQLALKRRKLGAIIGDQCSLGCNSVTNPGAILSPKCLVSPNFAVPPGYHAPETYFKAI